MMDRFTLNAHAHQDSFAVDTSVECHLTTGPVQHTTLFGIDYSRAHDFWSEEDGGAAPLDITGAERYARMPWNFRFRKQYRMVASLIAMAGGF